MSTVKFYTDNQGRKRPLTPVSGMRGPKKYQKPVSPVEIKVEETIQIEEKEEELKKQAASKPATTISK